MLKKCNVTDTLQLTFITFVYFLKEGPIFLIAIQSFLQYNP